MSIIDLSPEGLEKLKQLPKDDEDSVHSDWHGSAKPTGLPGKGHPGTGPGGNLSTLVKPVPPERVAGLPVCD